MCGASDKREEELSSNLPSQLKNAVSDFLNDQEWGATSEMTQDYPQDSNESKNKLAKIRRFIYFDKSKGKDTIWKTHTLEKYTLETSL